MQAATTQGRKRICIVGSGGYVGSKLYDHFSERHEVLGVDRHPRKDGKKVVKTTTEIDDKKLQSFDSVIYLGGLTGRRASAENPEKVYQENIGDILNLAKRMNKSQLLIFASTGGIYEGCGNNSASENTKINFEQLDSYSNSLLQREQALRKLSFSHKNAPQLIGLRFGTIAGRSAGQRVDLVPMVLVRSAHKTGVINVIRGETNRAFLALEDLLRAYEAIVNNAKSKGLQRFDVFNLASFNGDIRSVAREVALQMEAQILEKKTPGAQQESKGFTMDATKFQKTFGFEFTLDLRQVVSDIVDNIPESITPKGTHSLKEDL